MVHNFATHESQGYTAGWVFDAVIAGWNFDTVTAEPFGITALTMFE